jgi:putative DNA primase/helicase
MDPNRLTAEIRENRHCVLWRSEHRAGRLTKVPYCATRPARRAAVDDPATWAPFAETLAAFEAGHGDGIGLVFVRGDGLAGADLDHCRVASAFTVEALAIVRRLDSYTEVSPSGTGVHVLMRGTLPPGRRRWRWIELYDGARFFTVTSRHVAGTPRTLEERTEQLAALHRQLFDGITSPHGGPPPRPMRVAGDDAALLARAQRARNGAKFAALWRGDPAGYASRSEADLALCNLLSFWTGGDAPRVDRLFRASGLMRTKWDMLRGATTYGARTIAVALGRSA